MHNKLNVYHLSPYELHYVNKEGTKQDTTLNWDNESHVKRRTVNHHNEIKAKIQSNIMHSNKYSYLANAYGLKYDRQA